MSTSYPACPHRQARCHTKEAIMQINNETALTAGHPPFPCALANKFLAIAKKLVIPLNNDTALKVRHPILIHRFTDELCAIAEDTATGLDENAALFGVRTPHTPPTLIDWRADTVPIHVTIPLRDEVT